MDIVFASGNPHLPQVYGGVEVNTHELAQELASRSHGVAVLARLSLRTPFGLLQIGRELGYPVFRVRRPWDLAKQLSRFTIAVVQNGAMLEIARGFAQAGVPSVAYFHGLAFETWAAAELVAGRALPFFGYLANSQFTAERFWRLCRREAIVVPPLFRRERYATDARGNAVTFVNPVPEKGVELALEIAALCPEIRFVFVRGWPLGVTGLARLRWRARRLGNVTLRSPVRDMRAVYRDTRVLLAPSQWEHETWGRVVTEAQISGIPVIATDRGALPETVGSGGIILGYREPAAVWAAALRRLWRDAALYHRLSAAALLHSERPALDLEAQLTSLVHALEGALACWRTRSSAGTRSLQPRNSSP